jgi:hypothetical protein
MFMTFVALGLVLAILSAIVPFLVRVAVFLFVLLMHGVIALCIPLFYSAKKPTIRRGVVQ